MVGSQNQNRTLPKPHKRGLKLRGKFILLITSVLVVVLSLIAYILITGARAGQTESLNREAKGFSLAATKPIGDSFGLYHQSDPQLVKRQLQKLASQNPDISDIAVIDLKSLSQFSLSGKQLDISSESILSDSASTMANSAHQITLDIQPYFDAGGRHVYTVAYQISGALASKDIQRQEATIMALMVLGLLLIAVATYASVKYLFLEPLDQLAEAAEALVQGNFDITKFDNRSDEIGTVAVSIKNMAAALKSNITKLKELDVQKDEFIKIVSHNLRTPLTIIQSNAAFLDSSQLTPILKKMVQGIEDSARRLNLFSEQILTITDYETGKAGSGILAETSLNEMLSGLGREYAELAKSKNIVLQTNIQNGEVRFLSSQFLIAQAVRNLLDNALKFTPEQGTVVLAASIAQKVVIQVKDTGIGIKPEEIPRLFTKFHRGSDTLVYNYEGTGIGLYMVKLIIEEQKGTIRAESKLGEGTAFTIELPYVTPAVVQAEEQLSAQ
jgi:signal transduction histidine kinase